jgi:hypothetical protein
MTPSGTVLPLALLLGYGVVFAWRALGFSLIAFDDHPGQLYRVWHVVVHGPAPWAWNTGWWAGYPELQFYPPGFAYAAALLHVASRGAVSIAASYQTIVWLAYLAPALTVWLLLRRVLGDGWLALPGAFLALTLSAGLASGVEGGVHIGMVAARLGWAALPLLPLVLAGWMQGVRRFPWILVPLVGGIALTHPAHLPAAAVLLLLAAWRAEAPRGDAVRLVTVALGLAAGLTGFWSVPLLAHVAHTRALAWGSLSWSAIVGDPLLVTLVVLGALGTGARARRCRAVGPVATMLAVFPWAMVAVVVVDASVLEPLGLRWLPADRIVDSVWLAFVLAGGLVAARLVARIAGDRRRSRAALAAFAVAIAVLLGLPRQTLTLWAPAVEWPRFATIERGMRLDTLWATLRTAPTGRVLFVRSGVPLAFGDLHWRLHSHITSLTPLAVGREIINGTFTHPAPLAAFVYRGDAGPGAIRDLVERLDGRRLFGRALDDLDAPTFNDYADRLGVSVVVALEDDLGHLRVLADNPMFSRVPSSPPFVVYTRRDGARLPREVSPGHVRLTTPGVAGAWYPARMAYYPLWRASSDGRAVPIRRGPLGDLEVQVVRSEAPVDLVYHRGAAETAGLGVTAVSLLALAIAWIASRGRSR